MVWRRRGGGANAPSRIKGPCRIKAPCRIGLLQLLNSGADRIGTIEPEELRGSLRQFVERIELRRQDRLELQITLGEPFDARGIVELAPLGAQLGDGVPRT